MNRHVKRESSPSLYAKKHSFKSFSYPAIITIKSSLWSLNASHNVSIHSFEKLSRFSVFPRAYASSINNTPPILSLIASFVLSAVCPRYPATKSARVTFLNFVPELEIDEPEPELLFFFGGTYIDGNDDDVDAPLLLITPKLLYILPIIFATSVLPVPGEP